MSSLTRLIPSLLLLLASVPACTNETKIRILHTDVWNGRILPQDDKKPNGETLRKGGAVLTVGMIDQLRAQAEKEGYAPFTVNVGSSLLGSKEAWFTRGTSTLQFMNMMKLAAMSVGNRDFDLGVPTLQELAKEAEFPFIQANIINKGKGTIADFLKTHVVISLPDKTTVGIASLVGPDIETTISKTSFAGLAVSDPFAAFKTIQSSQDWAKANLRIVILNTSDESPEFVKRFQKEIAPFIHLVVRRNWFSKAVDSVGTFAGVPDLMIDPYFTSIGEYSLVLNRKSGKITQSSWRKVEVSSDTVQPSVEAARRLSEIQKNLAEILARRHGTLKFPLPHNFEGESTIGDFVCDQLEKQTKADFAVYNAGGLRAHPETTVTVGTLAQTIPFDNFVVLLKLTGAQINDLVKLNLTKNLKSNGLLQYSQNFHITYNFKGKTPSFKIQIGGKPLNPKRLYTIATNSFLADGGDKFTTFKEAKDPTTLNLRIREVLARRFEGNQTVAYIPKKRQFGLAR